MLWNALLDIRLCDDGSGGALSWGLSDNTRSWGMLLTSRLWWLFFEELRARGLGNERLARSLLGATHDDNDVLFVMIRCTRSMYYGSGWIFYRRQNKTTETCT